MDQTPSFIVQPFGPYILLDKLATGGMAEIYKARQSGARGFEKIIVIKKILQHLREDPEFVEMFEDEAKIAAQLNQANIVQIYELGEIEEVLYIAMEYVEGRNLRDVTRGLKNKSLHLSLEQCLYITTEVLKGLDYAHRKTDSVGERLDIIHRDMSPQNIVVSYEGEVKILDFGIAKAASRISRTEAGVLKGKFSYMSPEQAGGRAIDQSTDVYAVGVILHELLTSDRLFRAESDIQTLERVKAGFVPKPSEKNPQIPPRLDEIVLKTLAREPEDRYPNAGALLSDLTQFAFEHKLSMNSQELAAFMGSLFESQIADERNRLKEALAQANDPLLRAEKPIKTHIAFKADHYESPVEAGEEITVSTYPEKKRRKTLFLMLAGFFVLASVVTSFFFEREPSDPPAVTRPSPEESADQAPQTQDPTPPPDPEPSPPPTPEEEAPEGSTLSRIFERPQSVEPEVPPAAEEPPEVVEEVPTAEPSQWGRVNLVAPPEGYAQVFINDHLVGSVPGPRARGVSLEAGEHEIRCEASERTYRGKIVVEANRTHTIRCEDLESDSSR